MMAKDQFGFGTEKTDYEASNLSRFLHHLVPKIGIDVSNAAYILSTQTDSRRPEYSAIIKELEKLAPKGVKIGTIDVSQKPFSAITNPRAGAHYDYVNKQVYTAQRGVNPNPGLLAHELGHAQQYTKPNRSLLTRSALPSKIATMFGLTTLPLLVTEDEDTAKLMAGAGTAMSTPLFLHEMEASGKGRKMLMKAASKSGNKLGLLKSLAPFRGIPSYLFALGSPYIIYKYLKTQGQYKEN